MNLQSEYQLSLVQKYKASMEDGKGDIETDPRKGAFYYDPVIRLEARLTELRQNISHLGTKLSNFPQIRVRDHKDAKKLCDQNVLKPEISSHDPVYSLTRQNTWTVTGSSADSDTDTKSTPENLELNVPKVMIPAKIENQREQAKLNEKLNILEREKQKTCIHIQNEQNKVTLDLYKKMKKRGSVANASKVEQSKEQSIVSMNTSPQRSRRESDCFPSITSKSVLNVKVKGGRSRSPTPIPRMSIITVPTMTDAPDTSDAQDSSESKDDVNKSPSVDVTRIMSAAGCPALPPIHRVSSGRVTFVPDSFEGEPSEQKTKPKKGNKKNKRRMSRGMSRRMSQISFNKH